MTNQINQGKILIKDVFKEWFRIPEYQRPYVWGKDQVSNLLDDITEALKSRPESQYFLGSIVYQTRSRQEEDGGTSYEEHDLLDGQQRLTTCLLLLAVARDLTENPHLKEAAVKAISQEKNSFLGIPGRVRIVFDHRKHVRDFFEKYLEPTGGTNNVEALKDEVEKSPDISVKNMAAALIQIRDYFQGDKAPDLEKFFTFFLNYVLLIYVASKEFEDAFRLFTVLNDRGIKLRNADILKAQNLRAYQEQNASDAKIQEAAELWESMENELGEDFDLFLGHVRTILVQAKAQSTLIREFEENIYNAKLLEKGKNTFDLLERYHNSYQDIFSSNNHNTVNTWEFDDLIKLLNGASKSDIWLPPLLYYKNCFGMNQILPFLQKLENKFSADWILGVTPTIRLEAMNGILKAIKTAHEDTILTQPQKIASILASTAFQYDSKKLRLVLDQEEIYGRAFALYLLYKLDILSKSNQNPLAPLTKVSIEHILPQNPAASSQWGKDYTDLQREQWTHRLGNLVLIGRSKNTSLGRKDFAEKKAVYFGNHISAFNASLKVMNTYQSWAFTDLSNRHAEVVKQLIDYYNAH